MNAKIVLSKLLVGAVSIFIIVGCGDDDDDDNKTLALSQVEKSYYNLMCEKMIECNDFGNSFGPFFKDKAGCTDFFGKINEQEGNTIQDLVDAVDAGLVSYNPEKGYDCIAKMRAQSCDDFGRIDPQPCPDVFIGSIANGETCDQNEECADGYCDQADSECPGVCAAQKVIGDDCDDSSECDEGARCLNEKCAVYNGPVVVGGDCDPNENWCADNLFCNSETEKCEEPAAIGESCSGASGRLCGADGLCIEEKCVELNVIEASGEDCGYKSGETCALYENLACKIDDFDNLSGTCSEFAAEGDVCFDQANTTMLSCDMFADLYCDIPPDYDADGHCEPRKGKGKSCESGEECLSGDCNNNTCSDPNPAPVCE